MQKQVHDRHPVDIYAGLCLRHARKAQGMSRAVLGARLSSPISCQQIQKYEQGINRIAISRLYEFAKALQKPITFFLPGGDAAVTATFTPKEEKLLQHFRSLNISAQQALLAFLEGRP